MDVANWRKQRRVDLIARRKEIPQEAQRQADERITELLVAGFPMLERLTIGFYWPFNAEVDPRVAVLRFRHRGARSALPVVAAKNAPLEFREWAPGVATVPGAFGLPAPQTPVVVPDVLLMPPVGFDAAGYRLGYGGGYFDRTLARLTPHPLKIGLARDASRIDTIHPQPHDIPMDFVVTESGIHELTESGLALQEDLTAIAARVELLREARRTMTQAELATLLNTLLEAERAGAKVVAAYLTEIALDAQAQAKLLAVQRDESRNCVVLIGLLRHIGATPSNATGNFLQMAMAVVGNRERLAFLNRGQSWVARRISAALPRIADPHVRELLRAMGDSHVTNVGVCERLLEEEPAG